MAHKSELCIEGKWKKVEYSLTLSESWQLLMARLKSWLFGGCNADYMSEDLEDLLCGYNPIRHKIIQ